MGKIKLRVRYPTVALITALLLVGVVLQMPIWQKGRGRMAEDRGLTAAGSMSVAKRLPANLPGGSARDEQIAATEEMKKAVGELLNFNDALFRIYQLPSARVSVYLAWWETGRMSPRLVAAHTPDVCWPGNGWIRDQKAEDGHVALLDELRVAGFANGESRVFRMQNKPEYVVFWHKVGGEMLSYKTGFAPPWWAWIDEMWRGGINLRKEQLFVRISSDKPLESFWSKPEMEPLRKALLDLGLRAKVQPEIRGKGK